MSAQDRIRTHVEELFQDAPNNHRAVELKEELISNLVDRYEDLIAQGKSEETACNIVIAGIGNIDELIDGLREQNVFDMGYIAQERQKSALLVSLAVGLYIISFIFPAIFCSNLVPGMFNIALGVSLMFACWAVATGLLVYNGISKPKYVKAEDTIVEDFKQWNKGKSKQEAMLKAIQSTVWMVALVLFFGAGFFLSMFHVSWIFFLLAIVVNQIIKLIFIYRED